MGAKSGVLTARATLLAAMNDTMNDRKKLEMRLTQMDNFYTTQTMDRSYSNFTGHPWVPIHKGGMVMDQHPWSPMWACGELGHVVQNDSDPFELQPRIRAIREDIAVHAVKIGMLGDAEITACVAREIAGIGCPVVLDPVMVAKGGDRLLDAASVGALRDSLLPLASVVTPNLPEAADLLDRPEAKCRDDMQAQARALLALGPAAVLLKGGHLAGEVSDDLLATRETETWLSGPRIATGNTHGTGCTLSSALAAQLGAGLPLAEAATEAKRYITGAIAAADRLAVGSGHGPVHHFHAVGWGEDQRG